MSVKEAVRFNFLERQLSPSERAQFIIQLSKLDSTNKIITKALTQLFIHAPNAALEVNTMISTIIRKREKSEIELPQYKLDTIPKELIGHISSFTTQCDYANLSLSNRCINLGCNEPNRLQRLQLHHENQFDNIKLEIYPAVKSLEISLYQFAEALQYNVINKPAFQQLDELILYPDSVDYEDGDYSDEMIETFFDDSQSIDFSGITKFRCCNFINKGSEETHGYIFTTLLQKLGKLQCLKLEDFSCNIDIDEIQKKLPNLKGLEISIKNQDPHVLPNKLFKDLIFKFANQLEYLSFYGVHHIDYKLNSVNLNRLKRFKGYNMNKKYIDNILNTAVNLRKISINTSHSVTSLELENIMINIFDTCKSLNYIEYRCADMSNSGVVAALDGVSKGIIKTKERKREKLKIEIHATYMLDIKNVQKSLIPAIEGMIKNLENTRIQDYMFIWRMLEDQNILSKELLPNGIDKESYGIDKESSSIDEEMSLKKEALLLNGINGDQRFIEGTMIVYSKKSVQFMYEPYETD